MKTPLVSVEWLQENCKDPDLIILDGTQKLDSSSYKNNPEKIRIVQARYFNIKEEFSDTQSPYPNMLIDPKHFQDRCRKLGINNSSKIVVYDCVGIFSSPRVWWMFLTMGFKQIAVLDGGLPAWIDAGFETEKIRRETYAIGNFIAHFNQDNVKDLGFVTQSIHNKNHLLVDARSQGRFDGTAAEPRAGLKSGCIPNSINLPYTNLLNGVFFKSKEDLIDLFKPYDLSNKALTFSCGSGITACIVLLAFTIAHGENTFAVYDGSWTEWTTVHNE